ncbi:MAG: fluoride efflux transporter FluC [Bdellovibrionales bacterium]
MEQIIGIAAFSVLGAILRFGLDQWLVRFTQLQGLSTLAVNILGSFAAGIIIGLVTKQVLTGSWPTILLVGFCGSFTTFSAYSIQSLKLMEQGQLSWAMSFILVNPVLSLLAAYLGMIAIKS